MQEELEKNIKVLNYQIRNLERLLIKRNNENIRKILIAKKRYLKKLLIQYRKLIMKKNIIYKVRKNFFLINNTYNKKKILQK